MICQVWTSTSLSLPSCLETGARPIRRSQVWANNWTSPSFSSLQHEMGVIIWHLPVIARLWSHDLMCQWAQNSQLYQCPVGSLLHGLIASHQQGEFTQLVHQDGFRLGLILRVAELLSSMCGLLSSTSETVKKRMTSHVAISPIHLSLSLTSNLSSSALILETSRCHLSKCCPGGWKTMQLQDFHRFGTKKSSRLLLRMRANLSTLMWMVNRNALTFYCVDRWGQREASGIVLRDNYASKGL